MQQIVGLNDEEKYKASYEYTRIMTDSQGRSESFKSIFLKVRTIYHISLLYIPKQSFLTLFHFLQLLYIENPKVKIIYNQFYIRILIICIVINEMRKW